MHTSFDDRLEVCARFKDGSVIPLWFFWRGRKHEVEKVTFRWEERSGRSLIRHFSVSDGANVFEIGYDSEKSDWRLLSTYSD
jgi:hypothetical protein